MLQVALGIAVSFSPIDHAESLINNLNAVGFSIVEDSQCHSSLPLQLIGKPFSQLSSPDSPRMNSSFPKPTLTLAMTAVFSFSIAFCFLTALTTD